MPYQQHQDTEVREQEQTTINSSQYYTCYNYKYYKNYMFCGAGDVRL